MACTDHWTAMQPFDAVWCTMTSGSSSGTLFMTLLWASLAVGLYIHSDGVILPFALTLIFAGIIFSTVVPMGTTLGTVALVIGIPLIGTAAVYHMYVR